MPKSTGSRLYGYYKQNSKKGKLTAAQSRRVRHKDNRSSGTTQMVKRVGGGKKYKFTAAGKATATTPRRAPTYKVGRAKNPHRRRLNKRS